MKCKHCGRELQEQDCFCPSCGKAINEDAAKPNWKKRILIAVISFCLIIVAVGLLAVKQIRDPKNIKNIAVSFEGVNGEGRAYIQNRELERLGLDTLVDKDEFEYEIKPNHHLSNGDKVVLEIEDDGIFGKEYHLKYTVKGLKKASSAKDTKVDKKTITKANVDKLVSACKKDKKVIEQTANEYISKHYNIKDLSLTAIYLGLDDDDDDYELVVNFSYDQGKKRIAVVMEDVELTGDKLAVNELEVDDDIKLEAKSIEDINNQIRKRYKNLYLIV